MSEPGRSSEVTVPTRWCPTDPAHQLHEEELVATWVPGLGQYLLYQCWEELTLESTLFKVLLVIRIPAPFRDR